jgi:6-phosphofructokinase 2
VLTSVTSPRVLTVTLNPALDVSMTIDRLVPDRKLRAESAQREPGGGGVNVSRVLHRLGVNAPSFVVAGGPVGAELIECLRRDDVDVIDFPIDDNTRESLAISESITGFQYRISVPGPPAGDLVALRQAIVDAAIGANLVVFSGSVPPGVAPDFLASVIDSLSLDITTIVDTSGSALAMVARQCTTIIKPSQRELAELVGWEPSTTDQIEQAVAEVVGWGAVRAVVASRGPSGVVLMTPDSEAMWFRPPPVHPVSTVGAGDSMVAGIAAALVNGRSLDQAVRFGVAAGTAAVLTPGSELCDPEDVERLIGRVSAG